MRNRLDRSFGLDTGEFHLRRFLSVLKKRLWVVLTVFVIVVSAVVLRCYLMIPIYEASALLLIEKEDPKILDFEEVVALDSRGNDFYNTQYRILQSRSLVRSTIEDLGLMDKGVYRAVERAGQPWTEAEMGIAINRFLSQLQVRPVEKSRLAWVKFRSPDPALAAETANTLARNFIKQDLDRRYLTSQSAVEWLNERLASLKEKVKQSEVALQEFQEQNMIVSFEERRTITNQKLQEMNEAVTRARTERLKAEALLQEIRAIGSESASIDSLPSVIKNPLIQNMKSQYVSLKGSREQLSKRYGEKHPEIIKINSELGQLEDEIRSEIGKIIESAETEYRIFKSQEETLLEDLEKEKRAAAVLNRSYIRFSELKRNVESDRAILDNLLARSKETSVSVDLRSSNIRIVDAAEVPRRPVKPRTVFDIELSAILGLLLGIAGAMFLEYMDDTLRTPDDIKQLLNQPVLGNIPVWRDAKKGGGLIHSSTALKSAVAESFRILRVRVTGFSTKNGDNTMLVTGSSPGCGKTFVCSNLAMFLSVDKKKTLLIDCDLRKPSLHKIFGFKPKLGLGEFLSGDGAEPGRIIHRFKEFPFLSVIPASKPVPNPSELLGSRKMEELLAFLKKQFDLILIDSPPLLAVSDPTVLVQRVESVLLVTESGRTTAGELDRCTEAINQEGSRRIGVVINKLRRKSDRYPYYSYYHYAPRNEGEET